MWLPCSTYCNRINKIKQYNNLNRFSLHQLLLLRPNFLNGWNVSVGDLLLSDGTLVAYDATRSDFSKEITGTQKPIGVVYVIDDNNIPRGILVIRNSGDTKYR